MECCSPDAPFPSTVHRWTLQRSHKSALLLVVTLSGLSDAAQAVLLSIADRLADSGHRPAASHYLDAAIVLPSHRASNSKMKTRPILTARVPAKCSSHRRLMLRSSMSWRLASKDLDKHLKYSRPYTLLILIEPVLIPAPPPSRKGST